MHLQCRRHRKWKRHRFDPWVRKIPGGRHGNPLQYSCLWTEEPGGYSPWGHKETDTIEVTGYGHVHLLFPQLKILLTYAVLYLCNSGSFYYVDVVQTFWNVFVLYKEEFLFFKNLLLIGDKLLYNVVLISAIQQCKSAITEHVPPVSWASLFTLPIPTPH